MRLPLTTALLLLLLPLAAPLRGEEVRLPGPDGLMLNAELFLPKGTPRGAAILELHSCSGPNQKRDAEWARRLAAMGHVVLLPDSFGSRGLSSQCTNPARGVTAAAMRRQDTLAAAQWLAARPGSLAGGVVLMGWSDGAVTALAAVNGTLPAGLVRGVVAFYPACSGFADRSAWVPATKVMILVGEADQRNPSAPCHILADRLPDQITLVTYAGALHDFDMTVRPAEASSPSRHGKPAPAPPVSPNGAAREDALNRVPQFIAGLP